MQYSKFYTGQSRELARMILRNIEKIGSPFINILFKVYGLGLVTDCHMYSLLQLGCQWMYMLQNGISIAHLWGLHLHIKSHFYGIYIIQNITLTSSWLTSLSSNKFSTNFER